jgi:hypothetical protein
LLSPGRSQVHQPRRKNGVRVVSISGADGKTPAFAPRKTGIFGVIRHFPPFQVFYLEAWEFMSKYVSRLVRSPAALLPHEATG